MQKELSQVATVKNEGKVEFGTRPRRSQELVFKKNETFALINWVLAKPVIHPSPFNVIQLLLSSRRWCGNEKNCKKKTKGKALSRYETDIWEQSI